MAVRPFGMLFALAIVLTLPVCADDRQSGYRLLNGVEEMASAVHAETSVVVFWRAGAAYGTSHKSKALEYLKRAFSGASQLGDNAGVYRTEIVKATADLSLPDAIEMVRVLEDPSGAVDKIVTLLASRKEFDHAIEILALSPDSADYPYDAAGRLLQKLPADDPRRQVVFGRAAAAYAKRPSGPFTTLMELYGKQVSPDLVQTGIDAIARRIGEWKDDPNSFHGTADGGEPIEMHSPNQFELRELVSVLRMFNPKRADQIMASRADIRAALNGFRKERKTPEIKDKAEEDPKDSKDDSDLELSPPLTFSGAPDIESFTKQAQEYSVLEAQATKVMEALKKDPRQAMEEATKLPGSLRAEALAKIARYAASKDPEWARNVATKCLLLLREISDPAQRIMPAVAIAEALHELKDDEAAWPAIEGAVSDLATVYGHDINAKRPNLAMRDRWPSVQGCRMVSRSAAKTFGIKAETLLGSFQSPDLALVSRVEMARTFLGLPLDVHAIDVRW